MNADLKPWSDSMESQLLSLWGTMKQADIGIALGVSRMRVRHRAAKLGLKVRHRVHGVNPPKDLWIKFARAEAKRADIPTRIVLAGRERAACIPRWQAFKGLLDAHPQYSIAGLGRTAGWDHTAILHGLARLSGATPKDMTRKLVSRASGRWPVPIPPTGGG